MGKRNKRYAKQYVTFMLIPHRSDKKVLDLKIPRWSIPFSVGFLVLCIALFGGSLYYSTKVTTQLIKYHTLSTENRNLKDERNYYANETEKLKVAIQEIRERDQELRSMLGLKNPYSSTKTALLLKKKQIGNVYRGVIPSIATANISEELGDVDSALSSSRESYENLVSSIRQIKDNFEYIPSIWPIYGRIYSGYGWRRHPIFGRTEFHRGVDIPSFMGANIKATAKGLVAYAGWGGGYGNLVVIDHKFGFSSVYGHNSRLMVKKGDLVNKGQIIAEVGSTGLSTGPHLHYEIRRWNKAISPDKFLNIDIFTANREFW